MQSTRVTLQTIDDETVNKALPNKNYNDMEYIGELVVGTSLQTVDYENVPTTCRVYVKFDLRGAVPAKACLRSATLYMFREWWWYTTERDIGVYQAGDGWTEETITWNNAPPGGSLVDIWPAPFPGQLASWDVTQAVAAELQGDGVISFLVRETYEDEANFSVCGFSEREYGGGPSLAIEYGPPRELTWVGTPGYQSDGVDPQWGDANDTKFTFKVKCIDVTGQLPSSARCILESKAPGGDWATYRDLAMAKRSGRIETGAVYGVSTKLPNRTFRHRFAFTAANGKSIGGDPTEPTPGPYIIGPPHLAWSPRTGFKTDGVDPDAGPVGTTFRFAVLYQDSDGDVPVVKNLVIERNGALYKTVALTAATTGDRWTGRRYGGRVKLTRTGTYRYRFDFQDTSGPADGAPAAYKAGPTITGGAALVVSAVAAQPTHTGAQVTFGLSAPADVTATVLNVAGRPVRTLVADQPRTAGLQSLSWDRCSDAGLPVPAGRYVLRITARTADGQQAQALAAVEVGR